MLGVCRVGNSHRDTLKPEVPRGIPWILPFIRHQDYVLILEVLPVVISASHFAFTHRCNAICGRKPSFYVVMIILLAPQQSSERLSLDISHILIHPLWQDGCIVIICFLLAGGEYVSEAVNESVV